MEAQTAPGEEGRRGCICGPQQDNGRALPLVGLFRTPSWPALKSQEVRVGGKTKQSRQDIKRLLKYRVKKIR